MKVFVHIFAVYMLSLALVPCGDGGGGIADFVKHVFNIEHQEHGDHDSHSNACGDDFCSPFCICTCCASLFDSPEKMPLVIKTLPPVPNSTPSFISNAFQSNYISLVWQPPRAC